MTSLDVTASQTPRWLRGAATLTWPLLLTVVGLWVLSRVLAPPRAREGAT